jgi:hypothetical protein
MNDADIIKAFEFCYKDGRCEGCPLVGDRFCESTLPEAILDLINRRNAEIERLTNKCESVFLCHDEEIGQAKKWARAEAITEFAERLCEGRVSNDPVVIAVKVELEMMKEGVTDTNVGCKEKGEQ